MLRLFPGHLSTKKMCKHAVETFLLVIKYFPYQCKTKQMCDRAILKNGGML